MYISNKVRKKIRKIRRYLYLWCKRWRLLYSKEFREFENDKNMKIILIDTPEHGNLGDQAIVLAEQQFLEVECGIKKIYEFTSDEYCSSSHDIGSCINAEDIILIHGGGFIGTLWQNEEDILIQILKQFCENRLIIFPQTAFFENSANGRMEEEKFRKVVAECNDLTIFARDWQSYIILTEKIGLDKEHCFYVPDIVTYLKYNSIVVREDKVILCLRKDKERILDERVLNIIIEELKRKNCDIIGVDTVIERKIFKEVRESAVKEILDKFASGRLVITDRLHGMLFAALTGTPCIAVDNLSKKVSGVFQWIKNLDYVQCVDANKVNDKLLDKMLDLGHYSYSNQELQREFNRIRNVILSVSQ